MDELYLDHDEFLVLLDAVRAGSVVGLKQDILFPASIEEHRRLVEQGQQKLITRQLLQRLPSGEFALPELLLIIATVVTEPDLVVISTREEPERGEQLFLHYVVGQFVVEQTLPKEGQHRLATLPNRAALVPRLLAIFPIQPTDEVGAELQLSPEDAQALMNESHSEPTAALARLAEAGLQGPPAQLLTETLGAATLRVEVAMLQLEERTVSDGRSAVLAFGERGVWGFFQTKPGEPQLTFTSVNDSIFGSLLTDWLAALVKEPATP